MASPLFYMSKGYWSFDFFPSFMCSKVTVPFDFSSFFICLKATDFLVSFLLYMSNGYWSSTSLLLLYAQRLLSLVHLCVLLFANGYLLAGKKHLYNNLKVYACKTNRYEEKTSLYPFVYQSVTKPVLKDALLHCKRASFTLQKGMFCNAKGRLLHGKRASLTFQLWIFLTKVGC